MMYPPFMFHHEPGQEPPQLTKGQKIVFGIVAAAAIAGNAYVACTHEMPAKTAAPKTAPSAQQAKP